MDAPATHCDGCGQRFMGQPRLDVIWKRDSRKKNPKRLTVHESCFKARTMVKL